MLVFKIWVYNLEKENVETDKRLMDETRVVEGHSMAADSASHEEPRSHTYLVI